uniref:Uncharacterized protein n=1 Tax=Oryza brachyantha TaxID=4533 RepID=J3LCL2_ORYBR
MATSTPSTFKMKMKKLKLRMETGKSSVVRIQWHTRTSLHSRCSVHRNNGEGKETLREGLRGMEDQREASKSRWRPKPSRLRVRFGVQDKSALKRVARSHMNLD